MREFNFDNISNREWVGYNDGDLVIVKNFPSLKEANFKEISVDMILMIFCLKGEASVQINTKNWRLLKNDVLMCTPNVFIDDYWLSDDFDGKVIGFSTKAVDSSVYISKNVWQNLYHVHQNPIVHLRNKDIQTLSLYYRIAAEKLSSPDNVYYKEIMHSLLHCLIYEFLIITDRYLDRQQEFQGSNVKQQDIIFKRFVSLLVKEKGMIRSVSEAAERLNVSSKYLSSIIKNSSGKNALNIIHHYTVQEIIKRLKYTDKTIQEISNDMNFPSLSFFGKFFKQQMGISPKRYRKQGGNNKKL